MNIPQNIVVEHLTAWANNMFEGGYMLPTPNLFLGTNFKKLLVHACCADTNKGKFIQLNIGANLRPLINRNIPINEAIVNAVIKLHFPDWYHDESWPLANPDGASMPLYIKADYKTIWRVGEWAARRRMVCRKIANLIKSGDITLSLQATHSK